MPADASDAPACHTCDGEPVHHWFRKATPEEAAAFRAEVRRHRREDILLQDDLSDDEIDRRYGEPRTIVTGCADHDLAPEAGVDPAAAAQAGIERRALLHAADCAGHGACACPPGA